MEDLLPGIVIGLAIMIAFYAGKASAQEDKPRVPSELLELINEHRRRAASRGRAPSAFTVSRAEYNLLGDRVGPVYVHRDHGVTQAPNVAGVPLKVRG